MSDMRCPSCGMSVPDGLTSCPLCRSWVRKVKLRRVALWSVVVAEYVLIALIIVFHVGH
jgi:hypothetical protein